MLKIFDYIKRFDKITLFFHSHPDMDALGSCFAMQNFIEHNFKNKKVIIARSPTLKIEETKNIFPKQKNKPNNFLSQSLGIILDTANMERIAASEYKHCKTLIRIDHHPKVETIGEYEWVDDKYSACCEMLGELFIKYNKKGITKDCAKYLYVGILTDTNRFFYPSTTSNTLKIASELIATGFDREVLHHKLYLNPLKNIKFNHFLFSKAKFICDNKIGYIVLDKNDFKKNDVSEKTPIIHVLGNVEELKVWTTLYYDSVGKFWKGSLRSRNIDLRKIAKKFDGGGHKFACGYKLSKVEDFNKVLNEIKKII